MFYKIYIYSVCVCLCMISLSPLTRNLHQLLHSVITEASQGGICYDFNQNPKIVAVLWFSVLSNNKKKMKKKKNIVSRDIV